MEYGKITMPSHTEALEKRVDFLSEEIERLNKLIIALTNKSN